MNKFTLVPDVTEDFVLSFFDLIESIVTIDHKNRMTAAQAMKHPFFTSTEPKPCSASVEMLPEMLRADN